MDSDEEMNSNGQLKRKNPAIIYSEEEEVENITVQTVSADTNIAQRETQEQRSQGVANNTVDQQQQNVEQRHTQRKKKKRLSDDFVEYALTREQLNEKKSKGHLSYKFRKPDTNTVDQQNTNDNSRLKSNVWELFQIIVDESTEGKKVISNYVVCSSCMKLFVYNGETTSTLLRHAPCGKGQATMKKFLVAKKQTAFKEIDIKNIRDAAVKFVVKDYRPFYAIDCEGLKDLCFAMVQLGQRYPNMSNDDLKRIMPCRMTVCKDVRTKSLELINNISKEMRYCLNFAGGFASTLDLWTDNFKRKSYMSTTVHLNIFKDEKIAQKVYIINMDTIDDEIKDGDAVLREIKNVFHKYDITPEEIVQKVTFVTDRGGNIKSALTGYQLINCYAHFINNIVHSMCKSETMKGIISKASSLVRYFKLCGLNDSELLVRSLKSYCETRFNTVVEMLDSIEINYFVVLEILQKRQQKSRQDLISKVTCLNQSELKSIVDFLRLFEQLTTELEGEKYVTIHRVWPAYRKIQNHLLINENDSFLITQMKEEGSTYCSKNLLAFQPKSIHKTAVFLHPAFKNLRFVNNDEKQQIYQNVRTDISQLINGSLDENSNISSNASTRIAHEKSNNKSSSLLDEFMDENEDELIDLSSSDEVQRYIDIKVAKIADIDKFDLFSWWVDHSKLFPALFKLFLRTSCIPATSCPSERSFSGTSSLINIKRSQLIPDNVNALTLVSNAYKYN